MKPYFLRSSCVSRAMNDEDLLPLLGVTPTKRDGALSAELQESRPA